MTHRPDTVRSTETAQPSRHRGRSVIRAAGRGEKNERALLVAATGGGGAATLLRWEKC
jgi:hypothetical protein